MELTFIRDYAMYAAIFGMFAFAWFGWGQENPPQKLRPLLGIGSLFAAAVAGCGIYLAIKNWGAPTALHDSDMRTLFNVIFIVEFISALIGALALIKRKNADQVASWIAFVVGLHFVPLALVFQDIWLVLLAVLITSAVVAAPRIAPRVNLKTNTLVCILTGKILLIFAVRGLILFFLAQ